MMFIPQLYPIGIILHEVEKQVMYNIIPLLKCLVLSIVMKKRKERQLIFLKSWNGGGGNYMKPDLKYRKEYIKTLPSELERIKKNN